MRAPSRRARIRSPLRTSALRQPIVTCFSISNGSARRTRRCQQLFDWRGRLLHCSAVGLGQQPAQQRHRLCARAIGNGRDDRVHVQRHAFRNGFRRGLWDYSVQGPLNPGPVATRQNDDANVSSLSTSMAVKKNGFMIWSVTHGNVNFAMTSPSSNYARQYGAGRIGVGAFGSGYSADGTQAMVLSNTSSAQHLQDVAASFQPN